MDLTPNNTVPIGDCMMLADAHPKSDLQAQLNQIEAKLDRIGYHLGLIDEKTYKEWEAKRGR